MTCKALIIEDDPQAITVVTDALASMEHEWDIAGSMEEAVKRLKTNTYDYVLADISIPARAQNGIPRIQNLENLLERVASLKLKAIPPVIILSDYAANGVEESVDIMRLAIAMHHRGVVDIIAKPLPSKGRTVDRVVKKVLAGKVEHVRITWPESAPAGLTPSVSTEEEWLTVTQAAELLRRDVPALNLANARSRISTAASRKEFKLAGVRKDRRIEPDSFAAWRLKQRDRDLDDEDGDQD